MDTMLLVARYISQQAAEIERLTDQLTAAGITVDVKQAEIERLKAQGEETCKWMLDDDEYGVWETRCGEAIVFETETPQANGYKYCHYCGKQIEFAAREKREAANG